MPSTATEESIQALQTLGLSELEASIYAFLLEESPATGYRIAHTIGKPVANTYKGISALQDKGAVIVDDGESRLCRAVPPGELFGQMQQTLRQRCERVTETLAKLKTAPEDERVYRLPTREQVMERARSMLARCKQVALVVAFPQILEEIKADLEATTERGIGVLLKAYRPIEVKGAQIVLSNEADFLLEHFPGQELNLVTDAEEHLLALLDRTGREVIQAIWSGSAFLSYIQYNGLYNEWELTQQNSQIGAGVPTEVLNENRLRRAYPLMSTPGFRRLAQLGKATG
jgi:HTH-type transcriptional regulator, sugar sensing transcriptional regulator